MYDSKLMLERMAECGLNFYGLAKRATVDPKTAKKIVTTGEGQPAKVFLVARALNFPIKRNDFRPILKRKK